MKISFSSQDGDDLVLQREYECSVYGVSRKG